MIIVAQFCTANSKKMKRIVINTEDVNRYGFWVKTDGIDLGNFEKNPIMLYNHNRSYRGTTDEMLPIGKWKDLRVEGGALTGEPVFDENDEFAKKIARKYEHGILNACSIGISVTEWSSDPSLVKPGQTAATVVKCDLHEISICDIPANQNAVAMYDEQNEIINLSTPETGSGFKIPTLQKMNKEIALKLGLAADADEQACLNAIGQKDGRISELEQQLKTSNDRLKAYEDAEQKARSKEKEALLTSAIQSGRIDAKAREQFEKLFDADYENAKAVLAAIPERKSLTAEVHNGEGDETIVSMSWDELDKADKLQELKAKHPEVYAKKFNEKFNTQN